MPQKSVIMCFLRQAKQQHMDDQIAQSGVHSPKAFSKVPAPTPAGSVQFRSQGSPEKELTTLFSSLFVGLELFFKKKKGMKLLLLHFIKNQISFHKLLWEILSHFPKVTEVSWSLYSNWEKDVKEWFNKSKLTRLEGDFFFLPRSTCFLPHVCLLLSLCPLVRFHGPMIDQHAPREEEGAVEVAVTSGSLRVAMSTAGAAAKSREKGVVWYFPLNQHVCVWGRGGGGPVAVFSLQCSDDPVIWWSTPQYHTLPS